MNKIIKSESESFQKINDIFVFIRNKLKEKSEDISKPGMAGWCDEEVRQVENLTFKMYDGGYNAVLQSNCFKLIQSYTNSNGTCYEFEKGDLTDLEKCYNTLIKN